MKKCFVISSIGSGDSPERQKADNLLEKVIRPTLEKMDYSVTRADHIAEPHEITRSIVKHLEEDDLVIADVHDENPNVFYELGLRNAVNKPYILFKKIKQHPPFDISQNRAIENPFSNDVEIDDETIQKTIKTLKLFVSSSESNQADASESVASRYLKLTKLKKQFRMTLSTIAIAITLFSIFFTLIVILPIYFDESEMKMQTSIIESLVYHNMDDVMFGTHTVATMLKSSYDVETSLLTDSMNEKESTTLFVERLRDDVNHTGIFEKEFQTTPVSAYVYVMEYDDPCVFVAYAYLKEMDRDNVGRELLSCSFMKDIDFLLADIHASTGTIDYSFAVVTKVDLEPKDDKTDLIVSTAVDLTELSRQIANNIYMDDVRFILENRYGEVIFDCMKDQCPLNYKARAIAENDKKEFDKYSRGLTYNLGDYPGYYEYENVELNGSQLKWVPRNSMLLDDWTLHVLKIK
ncbi:hypothetical protein [Nitrosopumilus sp.]|uniref:hypothetical protein n=1 Tax=Nitrosopumilus sp. TaxID=2024843 RepID=UPI003B5AD8CC